MIRQPTSFATAYGWHMAAVAGREVDRHDGVPHCGWYKRKLVKGGPWVPVRIYLDRKIDPLTGELTEDEVMRIEVEGIEADDVEDQWTYLTPISKAEFDHLMDFRLRDGRMLDSRRPINLAAAPTPPQ